jgi:hypothetical protein
VTERPANPWIAFAAGAVAVLAVALVYFAWQARTDAADVARTAVAATKVLPDVEPPRLPDAPRIPDVPVPRPK